MIEYELQNLGKMTVTQQETGSYETVERFIIHFYTSASPLELCFNGMCKKSISTEGFHMALCKQQFWVYW